MNRLKSEMRTVLTLDAGGTNFIFSAMKGKEEAHAPLRKHAHADDLDRCIETVIAGFEEVLGSIQEKPVAISFAFPGPADYRTGVIGDLPNFPAFKGGVALGPILEDHFQLPVFINNDGNLFAFGEALEGTLPWLNERLRAEGSDRQFENLVGFTLGTGFGSGMVIGGEMYLGHSSSGPEIHNTLNAFHPEWNAEESVSTRAVQRVYAREAGLDFDGSLMPGDIYKIAKGQMPGEAIAARTAFSEFGRSLGASMANTLSLFDGIVVLGGGITGSWDLFSGAMFEELGQEYSDFRGQRNPRLSYPVYNLEEDSHFTLFAGEGIAHMEVPGSGRMVSYDAFPRTGVALSRLGASRAISVGACAFALQQLDQGNF